MASDIGGPARFASAIVPDTPLTQPTRSIYVGGAGNIRVRMWEKQNNVDLIAVPVGAIIPIQADLVVAAGTTATNLVALW